MAKVKVIKVFIDKDGRQHETDEVLELETARVKNLVNKGAVEVVEEEKPAPPKRKKKGA